MKRAFIICLLLLLVWLSLPPIRVGAVEAAATDREDISVLSVTVNVNTKTNRVYMELLLQNTGAEDAEITFALPEISAGINVDSLSVKTAGGEVTAALDGTVTLSVKAGGNTGVSYTYTPKHNLAYERAIGFDLRQLKDNFNDHIGHLDWTVDMPLYEIVLVREIQPVLYTVEDNRISVVLEDFTVNRLLDRVCLTRTTHQDLLLAAEESGDLIHRLILENYRNWYQHPEIILDNIVYKEDLGTGEKTIHGWSTLHNVLLASDLTEEDRGYIQSKNDFDKLYYWTYPFHVIGCVDEVPPSESGKAKMSTFALYDFLLWSLRPDYSFDSSDYKNFEAPAFIAWINHEEPVIYAEIISELPDLNEKEVYSAFEVIDERYDPGPEPDEDDYEDWDRFMEDYDAWYQKQDEYYELYEDLYETTFDVHITQHDLSETWFTDEKSVKEYEWAYPWHAYNPKLRSDRIRVVVVYEKDLTNPEELRDYLDTLHVKALVRSDIAVCSDKGFTVHSEYYPMVYTFTYSTYAYDGTEADSFDVLKNVLTELKPEYTLEEREEPLKNILSIPVLTYYRGYLYPVEEYVKEIELRNKRGEEHKITWGPTENVWIYADTWFDNHRGVLEKLFECPVPKQNAEEREETFRRSAEEKRAMLKQVRGELGLPTPEDVGVTRIPGLVIPERPTEEPTEEATEAPIEEVTEAPTEEVASPTVAPSEAPSEAEEASTTEPEQKTSSEASESLTEASEPGASGGRWILPTAIAAGVVALAATTVTVAVKKKKSK